MSALAPVINDMSLRKHPLLKDMFKAVESRHLTKDELNTYVKIVPQNAAHARAAAEVAKIEAKVVKKTVEEILDYYPFRQRFELAHEKIPRDIAYVSAYATQTMLMDDPQWFADKLLIWFKTIMQCFHFPGRQEEQKKTLFARKPDAHLLEVIRQADGLPPQRASIYFGYARLKHHYRLALSPEAWALMEAPLQQALDILSAE